MKTVLFNNHVDHVAILDIVSPLGLFGGGLITVNGRVVVTTVRHVREQSNDS